MGKTIAAIATPLAVGGISVVRISGEDALAVADRVFTSRSGEKLAEKRGYTASYGIVSAEGKELDESVALVFRAPHSYTGEDVVELSCHGGIVVTRELLRAVLSAGASMAGAGEFTKRAFLNGKLSLTQAEAVSDLIGAKNVQAVTAARSQLDGALWKKIAALKARLIAIAGQLAAWVDYPEEEIPGLTEEELSSGLEESRREMRELLSSFDSGRLIREGIRTVIAGKPNVGKSTLMNLLAGAQRSIVTDVAGTTRDIVEETVQLTDMTLRLCDTAGIRETEDTVERIGVELAQERLDSADLILAVFDAHFPLSEEDAVLMERIQDRPVVAVVNKSDLPLCLELDRIQAYFPNMVQISALDDTGLAALEEAIRQEVHLQRLDPSGAMLANERQRECALHANAALDEACEAVSMGMTYDAVGVSLDAAIEALLELTGERVTEEVVNHVFSNFCVGK
jgi:tRNA modification GTPase